MAKFNFNLKDPNSKAETPINLIVRWNNRKLKYATGESIEPKFWDGTKEKRNYQRAKETKLFPEFPELNTRLDHIESSAKSIFRQFLNENAGKIPQISELKEAFDKKIRMIPEIEKKDLFGFIRQFISESETRFNQSTGKKLAPGTIRIYKNSLLTLQEFGRNSKRRIDYDTIDLDFYHDYVNYLSQVKNLSNNTVGRHVKTLKCFLNEAFERNLTSNISFRSKRFKTITEEASNIYLSEMELNHLYELDLSEKPRLEKVRDLFLVGCWTGLRFSDFTNIQSENISPNYIEIKTKKTDENVIIPIHPTVRSIMRKYSMKYTNSLPPRISNVKMNKYLKELGKMLPELHVDVKIEFTKGGVKQTEFEKKYDLIMTHTARRSFCTNLFKDGVSPITIMKISGHRTEKAFMTYIKVTQNENAQILQNHWIKKELRVA